MAFHLEQSWAWSNSWWELFIPAIPIQKVCTTYEGKREVGACGTMEMLLKRTLGSDCRLHCLEVL